MEHEHLIYMDQFDGPTFRAFMEHYGEDVWNYDYFLTRSPYHADDISQDVFIKAYQSIASYRGASPVKHWLLRITHNTAMNFKRLAFFRKITLTDRMGVHQKAKSPSAEQQYLDEAYADSIWEQIMQLPAKHREVLLLSLRYEFGVKEIAELLNVSTGTVKSRLHRAKAKLKFLLKGEASYADE